MDKKVILNFIKWQFIRRMPKGDLFKCALKGNNLNDDTLDYYMYLCDMHKNLLLRYLFGVIRADVKKFDKFYNFLDSEYVKEDINYYNFELLTGEKFKLPVPNLEDRKIYRTELMDLVFPYLLGYPNIVNLPFNEGPYEYKNVDLKKHDIVFDLGANFGVFSAFASSKGCNVYAFEPTKKTIDNYLSKTAELNPNITISDLAVSDSNGTQEFTIDIKDCRCNGISKTKTNLLHHEEQKILIPTTTIDQFVCDNDIPTIDFIKADIEGGERLMLAGAKEVLKEFEPDLSICYYHLLDDFKVLSELIMDANPNYVIEHKWKKIYAYSKKKHR